MARLAEYGVAYTFHAPMIVAGEVDFAGSGDWTPASGDVKVSKNEGAQANITTLPSFSNGEWQYTLSATEMQSARIYVKIVDSATKAVEDQAFYIETYGHESAQHEVFPVNVTQVAGQTASAAATVDFDDIATVEAVTTAIGATGTGLSAIPWPAAWDAEVQSEVADALTAFAWSGITISAVSGAVGSISGVSFPANFDDMAIAATTGYVSVGSVGVNAVTGPNDFKSTSVTVSDKTGFSLAADQSAVTIGTVNTCTTNSDMRGTNDALLAASVPANFGDMAITATTGYVSVGGVGVNAVTGPDDFKADVSALATAANLATVAGYLDTEIAAILEDTGTTIPGLIGTAQADLDILTGTDGATLATAQLNYAPAKAGDQMDLVDAPNATAVTAIQGASSDPLANAVPGAYGAGTAGYLIGTNLDAPVSNIASNPSGSASFTRVLKDSSDQLIPECDFVITSSNTGMQTDKIWSGKSNPNGQISFELDDGNYWVWFQKTGMVFSNPAAFVVSSGAITGDVFE